MVRVVFYRDGRDRLSRFFASGHVEIPESSSDEYSLVCAAVSAILQAARAGLEGYIRITPAVTMERGNMELVVPERARGDAATAAILATAELALEQIALQYPQHVNVTRSRETG